MKRIIEIKSKGININFCKFIFTGLLNTIFGYAFYSLLLWATYSYKISLLIATLGGVLFNFHTFGRFVFGHTFNFLIFGKFILAYVISYVVNLLILSSLLVHFPYGPYVSQMLCIPVNIGMSWFLMNFWVFKLREKK